MTSTPSWPCLVRARLAPHPLPHPPPYKGGGKGWGFHPPLDAGGGKEGWGSFPACALIIVLLVGGVSLVGPAWAAPEEAGVQLSPHELLARARAFEAARRYDQAIIAYRAYLAARPEDDEVRGALARVLSWTEHYDEAAALYQAILSRHPADLDVRTALARVRAQQQQWDEAQRLYEEVLRDAPEHQEAKRGLADTLYWRGDYASALQYYQALYRTNPDPDLARRIQAVKAELTRPPPSVRAPIGAEIPTEKPDLSLPYRQYLKLGYSHFFYSRDNPDERDWLFEAAAASGPYTLIGRIEQLDRLGLDDTYLSGELYSPLWKGAWGYLEAGGGIGPEFTPEWRLGAEAFQALGFLHPVLSPVELSFGYRHLHFEASPVDVLVPGLTVYFPHNIWLTEKVYIVPDTDSKTLSSQLTWRATDRLQVFASGAFGTAGERFTAFEDITRVDTISIQAGLNLPLTRRVSLEAVGYYEDRETLYVRSGLSFNLLLHW
jgi:YaiO family outer membrane protein